MPVMGILLHKNRRILSLILAVTAAFAFVPPVHASHAVSAERPSHEHSRDEERVDCAACAPQTAMDCVRHCLRESDASLPFPAETRANTILDIVAPVARIPAELFKESITGIENHTRGSPDIILTTQKRE